MLDLLGFFWNTGKIQKSSICAMHATRRITATDAKGKVTAHEQSGQSTRP
jgi:hypothetical protein